MDAADLPGALLCPLARLGAATISSAGTAEAKARLKRAQAGTLDDEGIAALSAEADEMAALLLTSLAGTHCRSSYRYPCAMEGFEVFRRPASGSGAWRTLGRMVTVHRCGRIAFSAAAMTALGSPAAITYWVNEDAGLLGFRPAEPGTAGAYRVSGKGHSASARTVLRHMGAELGVSRRYALTEIGGMACIDLSVPGEPVRRAGRPAA